MKLIIDDADINSIRKLYEYYPVSGVTTNPSILMKAGRNPFEVLKEIRSFIGKEGDLHVQTIAKDADGIVLDARRIVSELGENTFVKIPAIPEGFKAMKSLRKDGIRVTATAVYTPLQGYLAAECGAEYAAPYINRIDNMGYDGVAVAKEIHDIYRNNDYNTGVLAASFKNSQQVLELCKYGIAAVTASPSVIENFVNNAAINSAVDAFLRDFENLTGKGITVSNC